MIEVTDEMKAAFRAAQNQRAEELVAANAPLGGHDILDRGLAAVLALVERDYRVRRRLNLQVEVDPRWACHRCGFPLTPCEVCREPSQCGDAWCTQHLPGEPS